MEKQTTLEALGKLAASVVELGQCFQRSLFFHEHFHIVDITTRGGPSRGAFKVWRYGEYY